MHAKCQRCHRPLKTAASRTLGYGPVCARRRLAEQSYSPAQQEKARLVVAAHGLAKTLIRTGKGRRVFSVISSSGTQTYFVTRGACTCRAGLNGRRCYHRLAVELVA